MDPLQQCFVVEPSVDHTHTIILLHGRGSSGEVFANSLLESGIASTATRSGRMTLVERFPTCKWIFPNAKPRYSTVFKTKLTEWFDIVSLSHPDEREDLQRPGLNEALEHLQALIRLEMEELPASNLLIGGISQGCATAALAMVASNLNIAGFIGMSGWIPFAEQIQKAAGTADGETNPALRATTSARRSIGLEDGQWPHIGRSSDWSQTPIFLGHEEHDPVVDCRLGQKARDVFKACGSSPEWHVYDSGDHWIQEPDELLNLTLFLETCFD